MKLSTLFWSAVVVAGAVYPINRANTPSPAALHAPAIVATETESTLPRDLVAVVMAVERNGGSRAEATASMHRLVENMRKFRAGRADAEFTSAMANIGGLPTDEPITVLRKFAAYADAHPGK